MEPTDKLREGGSEGQRVEWTDGGRDTWRAGQWERDNRYTEGGEGERTDRLEAELQIEETSEVCRYVRRKGGGG